jgi:hypothetical protein
MGNVPRPLRLDELKLIVVLSTVGSVVLTLHFVAIPLRIVLNLIVPQRRRKYLWETIACVVAFLSLSFVAYVTIASYDPSF